MTSYKKLESLGKGGMAEVFRALQVREHGFEKIVAIKEILPHLSDEPEVRQAFINEARLAAQLQHPNIVQIIDFYEERQNCYLVMEYLSGMDLATFLLRANYSLHTMPLNLAEYIVARVADALDYAYNRATDSQGKLLRIVHRDVSPQNIFITIDGQVKLLDFGIAKAANHSHKTRFGVVKGKKSYMSPEQVKGKLPDARSDIFSLGLVLYAMTAGRPLLEGDQYEIAEKLRQLSLNDLKKPLNFIKEKYGVLFSNILARALHPDPAKRYQRAAEMADALDELNQSESQSQWSRRLADYCLALPQKGITPEKTQENTISTTQRIPAAPDREQKNQGYRVPIWWSYIASVIMALFLAVVLFLSLAPSPSPEKSAAPVISSPESKPSEKEQSQKEAFLRNLKNKNWSAALFLLEKQSVDLQKQWLPELLQAYKNLRQDNPHLAVARLFELTQKKNLVNAEVWFALAMAYLAQKDYAAAEEGFRNSLALDPDNVEALYNLAYAYVRLEKYKQAIVFYEKSLSLEPPFKDEILFNLAALEASSGAIDKAIEHLNAALLFNPENKAARDYLATLRSSFPN
jgi:serine/threonine protein kinase